MAATMNSTSCPISCYGMYRSNDPMQNFKIRVRLERIISTSGLCYHDDEEHATLQGTSNELELSQFLPDEQPNSEVEEYTFSWQEKVFNQREYQLYAVESQCPGSLEKKYHRMINRMQKKRRKDGRPTNRLFSYSDADKASIEGNVSTMTCESRTYLTRDTSTLRHRPLVSKAAVERKGQSLPQTNIVNYEPTDVQLKDWHGPSAPFTTMHIMADVGTRNREGVGDAEEVVLCSIHVDTNGVMIITPDFNAGRKPYKLETGNLGRDVYLYTLEHASNCISTEEKEQEAKMFREIQANMLRLHILGEIDWMAEGDEPLYGVTQACATKCIGNKNVAHFSFPFAYQLICPLESLTDETTGNLPRWPHLCFQVKSRDSWNRFRTEGYGYLSMPTVPGVHSYRVNTWRPVVQSLGSRLRRYFIGGSPELEDISAAAITSAFQDKQLSKYGMQTQSSGTVTIRIQSVQQCQEFSSLEYRHRLGHLRDKLRLSTLQSSVVAVLEAFQRARQRMLAAREDIHI